MKLLRAVLLIAFAATACATPPQTPTLPSSTPAPTLTPTQAPSATPTFTPTPAPPGGGGTVFIGVGKALYPQGTTTEKPFSWFSAVSDGSAITPLEYDSVYSIAPAGDRIIVRTGGALSLVRPDGSGMVKLGTGADSLIPFARVVWLSSGEFVFAAGPEPADQAGSIYVASADGAKVTRLEKPASVAGDTLAVLFADSDETGVFWATGTQCQERDICQEKYFHTRLDDSDQQQVWQNVQSAGIQIHSSPSRKFITYSQYFGWSIKNGCTLATITGQPLSAVELDGYSYCLPGAWSPVADRLMLIGATKVDKVWQDRYVIWDEPGNRVTQLPQFNAAYCAQEKWTPDGSGLFLSGCAEKYVFGGKPTYVGSRLIRLADGTVTEYPDTNYCLSALSPDSKWALLYRCQTADGKPAASQLLNLQTKETRPILQEFVPEKVDALKTGWSMLWAAPPGVQIAASSSPSAEGSSGAQEAGTARILPTTNMVQVYVPAGEFTMGTDSESAQPSAKPAHKVNLDAFWIDQTEVTNRMYLACIAAGACTAPEYGGPGTGKSKGDIGSGAKRQNVEGSFLAQQYDNAAAADLPVVDVSWAQAYAYCAWAGETLPTEAQWEKAARGTEDRIFPWGSALPTRTLINNYFGQPVQVGSYPDGASPYGVLDLAGNVWEFVADWYGRDYYATSPQANPAGPTNGFAHVIRGGSYSSVDPAGLTVSVFNRNYEGGPGNTSHVGFRCASSGSTAAGSSPGVAAGAATASPTQPARASVPATPIKYGQKMSSSAQSGTVYYSFEGAKGDNIVVSLQLSNAHPNQAWCKQGMSASFEVRTDQLEPLETSGVSSNPSTTKIYELPYAGTYYIYARCDGSRCSYCAQLDLGLEQK